jgi:hypothetical protein
MTFKFLKKVLITCRYAMMLSVTVLGVSGTASATLIESIAALEEGDKYRVLFVTSTIRDATSTDINVYNSFVNAAAQNGTVTGVLGLTWAAIASTQAVNAQDNTGIRRSSNSDVSLFNTFGNVVTNSGAVFWGDWMLPEFIEGDGNGNRANSGYYTATGTEYDGSNAVGDTLGESTVLVGDAANPNCHYMNCTSREALSNFTFYGASNIVTVPASGQGISNNVTVPAPGTVILLSLGLAGLSFSRYRK